MTLEKTDKYIVIRPSEGRVLVNADNVVSECVYMPLEGDITAWTEKERAEVEAEMPRTDE